MESMKSFKGYGKVDELEERAFRQKARRRIIFLAVAVVVLLLAIVGAVAGTIIHHRNSKNDSYISIPATELTPSSSLRAVCSITRYPDACFSSISSLESTNTTDPEKLFKLSLQVALREITGFADYVNQTAVRANDARTKAAMEICSSVIDDAASSLNESIALMDVTSDEQLLSANKIDDMKTWLSATITNLDTCLDTLEEMNSTLVDSFQSKMENATELASNSLAIVTKILGLLSNFNIPIHRKLLADFPEWVDPTKRRLLAEVNPTPNVTVAADGSGDCLTIHEAVALVPKKGESMFLIYLKAGTYKENVVMEKNKWNVMIYGDGATKSIISGNLNFVDGTPTFATATFAVAAKGFIARDIKFENTAGASKHQAVAFRSGSDMSVIYRCSFDAFQDTLYPHSNRQFYRDCDVTGTIDFIFGNAAVVFQNCNIMPRQPLLNQFNTITAQGKKDPNQNTGISIQKCTISAFDNLTALTYLGRPWKEYSTTVIMQSTIGSFLDPKGWREWVSGVDPPTTIVYGEYLNTGPGAGTDHRVTWRGYKAALMSSEAARFTVGALIQGSSWLPQTSVTFDSAL